MYLQARREALIIKDLGDDLVVYDERADCAHELNGAAAAVWRRCDGRTDLDEIASQLPAELGLPADEEIVTLAITELSRAGLLETSGSVQHVSRRQVIGRLSLTAAAALMLPLVSTIVAPTPAMAQSGSPPTSAPTFSPPASPTTSPTPS